jgi:hypothetical protein
MVCMLLLSSYWPEPREHVLGLLDSSSDSVRYPQLHRELRESQLRKSKVIGMCVFGGCKRPCDAKFLL